MYVQVDGVARGSPLGVLFANFYMGSIETLIFHDNPTLKPNIYPRFIDDIFLNMTCPKRLRTTTPLILPSTWDAVDAELWREQVLN